jgi:hypothetical protein
MIPPYGSPRPDGIDTCRAFSGRARWGHSTRTAAEPTLRQPIEPPTLSFEDLTNAARNPPGGHLAAVGASRGAAVADRLEADVCMRSSVARWSVRASPLPTGHARARNRARRDQHSRAAHPAPRSGSLRGAPPPPLHPCSARSAPPRGCGRGPRSALARARRREAAKASPGRRIIGETL